MSPMAFIFGRSARRSIERVELERAYVRPGPSGLAVRHVLFGAVVERCNDAYHLDLYTVPKELSYQELPYL